MEIVSLIIIAIGLVALVGVYVMSRMARKDQPQNRKLPPIPTLLDEQGNETSSVQEDQAARDGKRPNANAQNLSDVVAPYESEAPQHNPNLPPQLIMFIAADGEDSFAGEDVLVALENAGLTFGEMNVFHRMVLTPQGEKSLFNVANGVKPWTLVPEEVAASHTPGLSMILNLPSPISDREAIHDFVRTAERINSRLGGILKNQKQEPITDEQRRAYFAMM